jgi:REP element-mobilizing transposase RayT
MPRKPRLHVPGGIYHVILRGNGRQAIFFDTDDRERWNSQLQTGLKRYGHRLHAYCWMTNHVHMAVQCAEAPLCDLMRHVASGYARETNRKYGRSGHLFERRHRALLLNDDTYLIELVRYIHHNPLRAGMVEDLGAYRWSSHGAYLTGNSPAWLTTRLVLSAFAPTTAAARAMYRSYMETPGSDEMSTRLRAGDPEDDRLIGKVETVRSPQDARPNASAQTLEELAAAICARHGVTVAEVVAPGRGRLYARIRAEIGLGAIERGVAGNAELARFFGRSQSNISYAIGRLRQRLRDSRHNTS